MKTAILSAIVVLSAMQLHAKPQKQTNRLLSKLAYEDRVQGDLGAQNRSVLSVREDSSTKSTQQSTSEVELRKKSNDDSWCSGLCKAYHNNDECVAGEQQKGVRENEAKARCGFASAGCYTGGCWK